MSDSRAILFVRHGIERNRQWAMCLEYADRQGYRVVGIASSSDDVLALVGLAAATVVIAAVADRDDGDRLLRSRLDERGGRLEYVRPPRSSSPTVAAGLVVNMYARGGTVLQLAHLLDMAPAAIRRELANNGVHLRPDDRPAP